MRKTIKLSWYQIQKLARQLASQIRTRRFRPDCIIGITVSGLIPLVLLAGEFKTKDVAAISARPYSKRRQGKLKITALPKINLRGKKVLLVDEIADRGTTLRHISGIFKRKYGAGTVKTAALVVNKKNCVFIPDFHVLEVDQWIVFPWDA
ncbi:hypothetical protein A3A39_01330 [Candidatus Kaiserbacteria bacterium RIFCSPLOWO2_01_FULL_54_13]|uniref:Phosphoribosyltransferase domain-containing protein n=1 Tax=Candidatus Kaiserbacteria bacterium RIFCSPLOWO2_01_FULL_54_13 TaxID=1798512 RepID=A0A1F6F045_9BACT|nr:MAG: hypothetical protein A3A39_01330 [Candidatus Kaiserbacteria bacterium RIFCSPLOWO2_01_FULL_54_13]